MTVPTYTISAEHPFGIKLMETLAALMVVKGQDNAEILRIVIEFKRWRDGQEAHLLPQFTKPRPKAKGRGK
jgi:hypothetical protein